MKPLLSRIALCLLAFVLAAKVSAQDTATLHNQLAGVYGVWRDSMVTRNLSRWQANTSHRRQVVVKNRIYSERGSFPAALFALPVAPPSLRSLKSMQVKLKGATAKIVYFGKVDFGVGGAPSDNLLVLDFVNENGRWKYDNAEFVNISALKGVREQLKKGDLKFLASPDFLPSGKVAPTPIAVNGPVKYIAKAYVYCPGREVQLQINRISRHLFQNTKKAEVISGGARDGRNDVQFAIKSLPGSMGTEPMAIRVYLLSEIQGVKPVMILDYEVKEKEKPKANGTMNFVVGPAAAKAAKGR